MSTIQMDLVVSDVRDVCHKTLENLPVSKDLPRLGRNFTCYSYEGGECKEKSFTADKAKDPIPLVVYKLIGYLSDALKYTHNTPFSEENFNNDVNMSIHESLTKYLSTHFGEKTRVVNLLKTCNQSPVIAALFHIRTALSKIDINFKDCRGQWFLHFHTGKDHDKPQITQRRMEQVYKMAPDNTRLLNLFKFEWELLFVFNSVECQVIEKVSLNLLRVDFSGEGMELPENDRKDYENRIRSTFDKCSACTNIQFA
ncbi:hypothetical protein AKO1_006577 [Acrasis kona]|uniref:Ras guanine nucleotide exchange factor glfB-like C-terminal domain-containing protein n=1 Tax=Acrasis kona TaxID=1008807 RepID=A0AAW2ZLR6_9EUKA